MKRKTKILTYSILSIGLLLSANTVNAYTESIPAITENEYSQTVTLKESEEKNYFENLKDKITFENNEYSKGDITKVSDSESNIKTVTEKEKLDKLFNTNNKNTLKKEFDEELEYEKDGYIGTLKLKDVEIETVSQGNYEKIEYLDLDFDGYSQNDLANIDKEITRNGKTWNLIDVDWEVETSKEVDGTKVPTKYSGTMHYERVGTYPNPVKYRATAIYEGEVEAVDKESTYEIKYNLIPKEEPVIEEKEPEEKTNYTPVLIGAIGILVILLGILSRKNCYIYNVQHKKIGSLRINENTKEINLDKFKNDSKTYIIKLNNSIFNKIKNQKATIILNGKKIEIMIVKNEFPITL